MSIKAGRSERHVINNRNKMYKIIDEYCYKSKNLYNYANYNVRQNFIKNNRYTSYNELARDIKDSLPFKDIGSNSGQHVLKYLDRNWKSYFVTIKDWSKNKGKYFGKPKLPNYLEKDGRFVFVMTNMQSKIIDGHLQFSFKPFKPYNNLVKTKVNGKHMQTRFIPKEDHYVVEVVYEKEVDDAVSANERIMGIDLGLHRLMSVYNNIGVKPFAINGGDLKAFNNFYNKELAKYQEKAKRANGSNWTKRLQRLTTKRNHKIDNLLHKSSRYIIDWCSQNKIDTVVVGYNKSWKQEINIGKKNNQKFVGIPFYKLVKQLEYKCQDVGINFITTEESYTSKASFIDEDSIQKGNYSGKRIKRGLYKTNGGKIINADINGAGNIIRKVFPNAFTDGIKGVDFHPEIIDL